MSKLKDELAKEIFNDNLDFIIFKILKLFSFGKASKRVLFIYRLAKMLYDSKYRVLSMLLFSKLEKNHAVFISPEAIVGIGLKMPHPNGIVIGEGAVIGSNVTIFQQVTLGGARMGDSKLKSYPEIGDNSILFAGSKCLGKIKVGKNCIIGANAVVIKDIPDNNTAVGVPAKCFPNSSHEND
jgi:serine O-acetyltransferase